MEDHEKRPCACGCNCSCGCDDNVSNQTSVSSSVLRSVDNPDSLWHPSAKIKWVFLEEGDERQIIG